jgi:uridine phosphorylase
LSYAGQFFHSERDVLYHYSTIFTIETLISQRENWRNPEAKVRHRKAEGCITVEMEAAAFFAVAQFRSVQFDQLLYGGDDVSSSEWDSRLWDSHTSVREKLFWLAAEACLLL